MQPIPGAVPPIRDRIIGIGESRQLRRRLFVETQLPMLKSPDQTGCSGCRPPTDRSARSRSPRPSKRTNPRPPRTRAPRPPCGYAGISAQACVRMEWENSQACCRVRKRLRPCSFWSSPEDPESDRLLSSGARFWQRNRRRDLTRRRRHRHLESQLHRSLGPRATGVDLHDEVGEFGDFVKIAGIESQRGQMIGSLAAHGFGPRRIVGQLAEGSRAFGDLVGTNLAHGLPRRARDANGVPGSVAAAWL